MTDGVHSFVLFNYPMDGLQWSGRRAPAVVGFTTADGTYFINSPLSGSRFVTLLDNNAALSNVGVKGRLFYRLSNIQSRCGAVINCLRWYNNDLQVNGLFPLWTLFLPPCPCTYFQAIRDWRFRVERFTISTVCFVSLFPSLFGAQSECCYRVRFVFFFRFFFFRIVGGSLILGPTDGGSASRYNSFFFPSLHAQFDLQPFQDCCVLSNLCHLYYQRRPSRLWLDYRPPFFGKQQEIHC